MGNNKKTVKCSFCNRLGHNRVSCLKLKEEVKKLEDKYGANHPDVLEHKTYIKSYSNKSQHNANKVRYCSYCREQKHNARTCKHKKKDLQKLKKVNHEWRRKIVSDLRMKGIGLGSIICNNNTVSVVENKNSPWTVVSIDWESVNWITDNARVFKVINMSNPSIQRNLTLEQILNDSESYYHRWEVLSRSDVYDFPHGWEEISDPVFYRTCLEIFEGISKKQFDTIFLEISTGGSSLLKNTFYLNSGIDTEGDY